MKAFILSLVILLTFVCQSIAQINPVNNLTWDSWYVTPNNYFILEWQEPDLPRDDLIGYNIYREDELFIFLTETSMYTTEEGSNCGGVDFLLYGDPIGVFTAYVTAVYNPGQVESTPEEVNIEGIALNIEENSIVDNNVYPNPTKGILNINKSNLNAIQLYDITGKLIKEYEPTPTIDLSTLPKGIYLVKLTYNDGFDLKKVILK